MRVVGASVLNNDAKYSLSRGPGAGGVWTCVFCTGFGALLFGARLGIIGVGAACLKRTGPSVLLANERSPDLGRWSLIFPNCGESVSVEPLFANACNCVYPVAFRLSIVRSCFQKQN
jgi:hypothetical protein